MENIYLIGMMGAGKTATGKALAKLTHMTFIDLDEEIESQNHQSINQIFEEKGEAFFRAQEKKILEETSAGINQVVATGGGIVLEPRNIERMDQTGRIIFLAASFEMLCSRVQDKKDRPLLKAADPKSVLFQIFQARSPLYESATEWKIMTDGMTPEAVAKRIVERFLK